MATENNITFKYKYPEDYNPLYVNGAYGGINVQGEIVANFYFERIPMPKTITHELKSDGNLGDILLTCPEDLAKSVVRYVQSGVVMNLEVAKQIHTWLGKQIELRESQNQKKK